MRWVSVWKIAWGWWINKSTQERLPSRKRSHIPPNGKFGKSSTQNCLYLGNILLPWRVYIQLRVKGISNMHFARPWNLGQAITPTWKFCWLDFSTQKTAQSRWDTWRQNTPRVPFFKQSAVLPGTLAVKDPPVFKANSETLCSNFPFNNITFFRRHCDKKYRTHYTIHWHPQLPTRTPYGWTTWLGEWNLQVPLPAYFTSNIFYGVLHLGICKD